MRTCSKAIARQAIVAHMSFVDVSGARLWVEEEGEGPAVVFVHGGLGDSRLWEPQAHALERARERERQFIADASHELRTPLTALRGNAAYIARHGADRATLDDLALDAERVSRLVDDLLALSREDAGTPRERTRAP